MKNLLRVLDAVVKMVKLSVRKIIAWEPLYNVTRKRASRKTLVEYTMQKGAIELDGSGYSLIKLERELGSNNSDFEIIVDDIKICKIDKNSGRVYFSENAIKNNYELVEHARRILRNLSKGGLKLNDSFKEYFESKDSYDNTYESNISTHLSAVGWQIF